MKKLQHHWIKANKNITATSIKCAIGDHFMVRAPVPLVFFYQKPILSQVIIEAVQLALNDYPVFAGRMQKQNGHLYIQCNNAGVKFSEHRHPDVMMKIINTLPKQPKTLFVDMINPNKILKRDEPVLTIKLTSFACGTAIGFCWNHCVGDMMSFTSFLKHASNSISGQESSVVKITSDRDAYLEKHLVDHFQMDSTKQSAGLTYLKNKDLMKVIWYVLQHRKSKQGVCLYFTDEEMQAMKLDYGHRANRLLSRNDVLCAHVMKVLLTLSLRSKPKGLSVIVNYRRRIGLPENLLGNFIGALKIPTHENNSSEKLASAIRDGILHYHEREFNYFSTCEYVRQQGGMRAIGRMMPTIMLPNQKNLIVTNWCQFDLYNTTFGVEKPLFVTPFGEAPLPWLASIMPGLYGKGLMFSMILPKSVAKEMTRDECISKIHAYRSTHERLPEDFIQCNWVK